MRLLPLSLLLLACPQVDEAPVVDPPAEVLPEAGSSPVGDGSLGPGEAVDGRDRKRMDIDQLGASIEVATGMRWTEGPGTSGVDELTQLEATLGKPDFYQTTLEDLDPGLVFSKFLTDASTSVCTKLLDQEGNCTEESDCTFVADITHSWETDSDAIEDNLSRQILRFHGREVEPGSDEMESWTWLWQTVYTRSTDTIDTGWAKGEVNTDATQAAWRAVCAALIQHPDFYTY